MKLKLALASAAILVVASCGWIGGSKDTSYAERSETISLSGTVESVDLENRLFKVRNGGTAIVFKAGPQVQNLPQLEAGDTIELDYYQSVAVGMADPSDPGTTVGEGLAMSAMPGEKPGAAVIGSVSGVVEFVSYDPASKVATIKLDDGTVQSVSVAPEMRSFAEARLPGDRIVVAIDRAVAVVVTEVE